MGGEPVSIVGVVVEDESSARAVKRVLCSCAYILLVNGVGYGLQIALARTVGTIVLAAIFALAVPACGYFGAKQRSKPLVACFWCCNVCNLLGLLAVAALLSLLLANANNLIFEFIDPINDCCSQFEGCDWEYQNATCAEVSNHVSAARLQ